MRRAALIIRPVVGALAWLTNIVCKNDILARSEIEGGICIVDEGNVTCGAKSIGAGTVVGSRTTIGMRLADGGLPRVGRNVWIGSDCVVYGEVVIGDGATLLPGTVATRDVPSGAVMQGNPARLVLRHFDNTQLREQSSPDLAQVFSVDRNVQDRTATIGMS